MVQVIWIVVQGRGVPHPLCLLSIQGDSSYFALASGLFYSRPFPRRRNVSVSPLSTELSSVNILISVLESLPLVRRNGPYVVLVSYKVLISFRLHRWHLKSGKSGTFTEPEKKTTFSLPKTFKTRVFTTLDSKTFKVTTDNPHLMFSLFVRLVDLPTTSIGPHYYYWNGLHHRSLHHLFHCIRLIQNSISVSQTIT